MIRKICLSLALLSAAISIQASVKLQKQGTATQLLIDGKPMLLLAGELSNSAATSIADIDEVMPRMKETGLNSVFIPAYWDLIEPQEGKYDFSLIDRVIEKARENDLKVVFLWFGAWKNSMSCYAPEWFKKDTKKYSRAMTELGKPLEIASCFSENVLNADKRAFLQLMQHIKDTDAQQQTVIMIQVENEIGMLESARDFSPLAQKAYQQQVPAELIKALKLSKKGSWEQVFGNDLYAQEKFQAYYYAKYVEQLAQAGKAIYDIPMYVNAAMNSRGRKPGEYPSAGPLAHLINIWKCAAPSIDIYAPDIYDTGFKNWVSQYKLPNNPFFTPEVRLSETSPIKALYTFGEVDAISHSPFAIDQASPKVKEEVRRGYDFINSLSPLILQNQGKGRSWGLLFDHEDKERVIEDGDLSITCRHFFTLPWDPRATDGSKWQEGGGMILRIAKNEYLIAGNGIVVVFQKTTEKQQAEEKKLGEDGFIDNGNQHKTGNPTKQNTTNPAHFQGKRIGLASVDQVKVNPDGTLQYIRRDNGDQDHQGRHARISCGEWKILHVKLYEY